MKIGEKTLSEVSGRVAGLMREHLSSINGVFGEEGEIKISMPVKMKMENGKIKIEIGCSFVVEKLEDTSTTWVDESQLDLPLTPMRNCPIRKGETRTEKFCKEKCGLRYQVIFAHGNGMPDIFEKGEAHDGYGADTALMQFRPCSAWSDDDTHEHVTEMLSWEPAPPTAREMRSFRIRNTITGKWWEGPALDDADACLKAGWPGHDCEIKVKNETGAWCKYKAPEKSKEENSCPSCQHRKGMMNKKQGIKLPPFIGGKCTRVGGLCEAIKEAA